MKYKYKPLDHFVNSLITLTIIGGPITWLVDTKPADKYRTWVKTYFIPTAKKLLKAALENEDVRNEVKKISDLTVDKILTSVPINSDIRKIAKITSDKAFKKVVKKLTEKEEKK